MRWHALGVDYEMAGKDLIESVKLSGRICRALGSEPPEGFNYELFLDEQGQKISKSKGNGLTIEDWLTYASPESLSLFMYGKPTAAKRLFFDVIPRAVDDYLTFLDAYPTPEPPRSGSATPPGTSTPARRPAPEKLPPEGGDRRRSPSPCCSTSWPSPTPRIPAVLWGFLRNYAPGRLARRAIRGVDRLVTYAVALLPRLRAAGEDLSGRPMRSRREALRRARAAMLAGLPPGARARRRSRARSTMSPAPSPATRISSAKTATPERPGVSNDWFNMLYQVLLGEPKGPRFGSFVALYGVARDAAR